MAKPKNTPKILNIQSHIGPKSEIAGKIISINLKNTSMFAIGDIKLTPARYWAKISHGQTKEYYDVIEKAIQMGNIVYGKQYIAPIEKDPKVLEMYWDLVKTNGKGKNVIAAFKILIRAGKDGNHSISEIADYCLQQEAKSRNRKEVIAFLKEVAAYEEYNELAIPKPYDDEEGKIEVVIDPIAKVAMPKNLPPPPTLNSSQILDDVFKI